MLLKFITAWKRRALPTRLRDVKYAKTSYSQYGEDLIVQSLLRGRDTGTYVDVGCFHPAKWSNTYGFYRIGWKGVCIDPNPACEELWRKWRPRDTFVNVAISSVAREVKYIEKPNLPHENFIIADATQEISHDGRASTVRAARLQDILDETMPRGEAIDFLSIDCEGHDLVVLQSNDFERYRPKVLVVEDHQRLGETDIHRFCESQGYRLVGFTVVSRVYRDTRG